MTQQAIKVLMVDDEPEEIRSVQTYFGYYPAEIRMVVGYPDYRDILNRIEQVAPDVLIMDNKIGRDDQAGINALPDIHSRFPRLPLVIRSAFYDEKSVRYAMQHGASGYLTKKEGVVGLKEAVIVANRHGVGGLSPLAWKAFLATYRIPNLGTYELTPREVEVVTYMLQGYNGPGIAERMGVTSETIASHKKSIYGKTMVENQNELIDKLRGRS